MDADHGVRRRQQLPVWIAGRGGEVVGRAGGARAPRRAVEARVWACDGRLSAGSEDHDRTRSHGVGSSIPTRCDPQGHAPRGILCSAAPCPSTAAPDHSIPHRSPTHGVNPPTPKHSVATEPVGFSDQAAQLLTLLLDLMPGLDFHLKEGSWGEGAGGPLKPCTPQCCSPDRSSAPLRHGGITPGQLALQCPRHLADLLNRLGPEELLHLLLHRARHGSLPSHAPGQAASAHTFCAT